MRQRDASKIAATTQLDGRSPHLQASGIDSPGALGRGGNNVEVVGSRGEHRREVRGRGSRVGVRWCYPSIQQLRLPVSSSGFKAVAALRSWHRGLRHRLLQLLGVDDSWWL